MLMKLVCEANNKQSKEGKLGPKTHLQLLLIARGSAKQSETEIFDIVTSSKKFFFFLKCFLRSSFVKSKSWVLDY